MLFPFTPHSPASKKQDGSIGAKDLTKKIQDVVDCLNDKFNSLTEDEHIKLSAMMSDIIKKLGEAAKKKSNEHTMPSNPMVADLPTPFNNNDKDKLLRNVCKEWC